MNFVMMETNPSIGLMISQSTKNSRYHLILAMQGIGKQTHHSYCVCHRVYFCMYLHSGKDVEHSKHIASEEEVSDKQRVQPKWV